MAVGVRVLLRVLPRSRRMEVQVSACLLACLTLAGCNDGETSKPKGDERAAVNTKGPSGEEDPETIAEMFRFAADGNVRPRVECFPMTQGNTALRRLAARQIRYRAVLLQDWN